MDFMISKGENPIQPSWNKFEYVLLETIIDYMAEKSMELDENIVCKIYNMMVQHAESTPAQLTIPVLKKSVASIRSMTKKLKQQVLLFREFYLKQVMINCK